MLGASVIIATSAVGSLKPKKIGIESLVIPTDYIDESGREDHLFKTGIVVHANPRPAFSEGLRGILIECASQGTYFNTTHNKGTYVCIPGDRFGTSAEGKRRGKYADIVGMTLCPEAALALQAGIHYAVAAFVVDSDSDANHEQGTLAVMKKLSEPERVPAYIEKVLKRAKAYASTAPSLDTQLRGNIIPHDLERIINPHLRKIAERLVEQYCGKD